MRIDNDIPVSLSKLQKPLAKGLSKNKETSDEKAAYNKKLKEACNGFEELFVQKMLQVMRESTEKTDLLFGGGRGEEIFQDMLDENYSKIITKSRAFGLSDMIFEHTKKT